MSHDGGKNNEFILIRMVDFTLMERETMVWIDFNPMPSGPVSIKGCDRASDIIPIDGVTIDIGYISI